jgi:pimeloyl-ACP methyl ester carboxylesterase
MFKFLVAMILFQGLLWGFSQPAAATATSADGIVFLHGIGRSHSSMGFLEKSFAQEGYRVLALTYPSRDKNLNDLAVWIHDNEKFQRFATGVSGHIHFVTHSMGGLVVREYLSKYQTEIEAGGKLGAVIMLAPPLNGSEIADAYHRYFWYKGFYGPAGMELTTAAQSALHYDIYYDLGVIAGTKSWAYPDSFLIPGPNDGRVSVESTKIKGMRDHITINASHTFIMHRKDVFDYISGFIKNRRFLPSQ